MIRRLLLNSGLFALFVSSVATAQTVGDLVDQAHPCGSSPFGTFARQLAQAQSCMFPDALVEVAPGSGMTISSNALPFTSPQTRDALYRARKSTSFNINSAFRTVLEQYWLYTATAPRCGAVAPPGTSNHESGTAVDIQQYSGARSALQGGGCQWPNIPNDPWHFNCPPFGAQKRTVLVLQRLWNLNHPNDRIDEDGSFGPQTRGRLRMVPANGFAYNGCGPNCTSGRGDDAACGEQLLARQPVAYAPPTSTDVNGDGRDDLCARGIAGLRCWPSQETGWSEQWEPIPWSDESGWANPEYYATLRMGDIDGDGRADACARSSEGIDCALSLADGFAAPTRWNAEFSDERGWNTVARYSTLRLADINGDGRDDLCARDAAGAACWLSSGVAFDTFVEGPAWSDEAGFTGPEHYGTFRTGDINGDGRADVCMRGPEGVHCALSGGDIFAANLVGPAWNDATGFRGREYWSTLRLADVNGDGFADLCIRSAEDYRCHFSSGEAFGDAIVVAPLADDLGWADPSNYETLRVGDVDGDRANDVCARSDDGVQCWRWDGATFEQIAGPTWSDASSWNDAKYYQTMRLGDFNGDGSSDICARAAAGWRCHPAGDIGFGEAVAFDELQDETGWGQPQYWSTVLMGRLATAGAIRSVGDDGGLDDGGLDDGGLGDGDDNLKSTCGVQASGAPWSGALGLLIFAILLRRRSLR